METVASEKNEASPVFYLHEKKTTQTKKTLSQPHLVRYVDATLPVVFASM